MSAIYSEIFEAFRSIGVAEDKALKAAEAFGKKDDNRFDRIGAKLDKLEAGVVELKAGTKLLKWTMGFLLAFQVAIPVKLFVR